jgi:hypothetical protein
LVDRQANNLLDLQGLVPNITLQQRLSSGVVTIRLFLRRLWGAVFITFFA